LTQKLKITKADFAELQKLGTKKNQKKLRKDIM